MAFNWRKQATVARKFTLADFTYNMYLFQENFSYNQECLPKQQRPLVDSFMGLVGKYLDGNVTLEEIGDFRKELIYQNENIQAYADYFAAYEYVLQRIEPRFTDDIKLADISDQEVLLAVARYLKEEDDLIVTFDHIQRLMSQLPVRLTRQKFYSIIWQAMSQYIGAGKQTVEHYLYLIRCSCLAELTEEELSNQEEYYGWLQCLRKFSWKDIVLEDFEDAKKIIKKANDALIQVADVLIYLQDLIDGLYLLVFTEEDAVRDNNIESDASYIQRQLYQIYLDGADEIPEALEEELSKLEEILERELDRYQTLDEAPEEDSSLNARKGRVLAKLMSSSKFFELEEPNDDTLLSRGDLKEAVDTLIERIDPVIRSLQKPVARAVMAGSFFNMPLCFSGMEEFLNYIEGALASCTDSVEKEASKQILLDIMENGDYAF